MSETAAPAMPSAVETILLAELSHRMMNELAGAIAVLRLAHRRCDDEHARHALDDACDRLQAFSEVHQLLAPHGALGRRADPCELQTLCAALSRARLEPAGIRLLLSQDVLLLGGRQGWIINLAVAELVTNAARHAFDDDAGSIEVHLTAEEGYGICRVCDDGCGMPIHRPGTGSRILDALVTELRGAWQLRRGSSGTDAVIKFPLAPERAALER